MDIELYGYSFFVEDDWLEKAGIMPFSMKDGHYKYIKKDSQNVFIVKISEIDPHIRGEGVPIFKDGEVDGQIKSKEERVLDILRAFKESIPLPPVEIIEIKQKDYRFELYHGCHRLHLSLLVGLDLIPAIYAPEL